MSDETIYERLGVRRVINGMGTYTVLGGSLMPPEVLRAMTEAADAFVSIPDLREKIGARIADLLGVPAAMVTSGAASAITVATAACIVIGENLGDLARLPNASAIRNEVILQTAHRTGYEPQIELTGAKLIWVETRDELDRAIRETTAMLFFLNFAEPLGKIGRAEWIEVGQTRGIPTFLDAAADVPPVSRLWEYVQEGFDLVAFSGGKGLRGPQSTGLLLGRVDLIALAEAAISPQDGIGRGMKVGKEELAGLLAAVERYLTLDHEAEWRAWQARAEELVERLSKHPAIRATIDVPAIANHAPQVMVTWDETRCRSDAETISRRLREGDPPIALLVEGPQSLRIAAWTLRDDEVATVARRILAELERFD
ncbi:MAG: hypothetical protein ABS79_02075 [Planctomycetes bacterium SCN 63-9]|nr:MAG: hypothetical protein ABS79_02075 [Planctomycetes bacterium SCN 63-9]